MLGVAVVEH